MHKYVVINTHSYIFTYTFSNLTLCVIDEASRAQERLQEIAKQKAMDGLPPNTPDTEEEILLKKTIVKTTGHV